MKHKSIFIFEINKASLTGLKKLRPDAVFIGSKFATTNNIIKLRKVLPVKSQVNVEIGIFAGKDKIEKYSDALPVESRGGLQNVDWYYGVCPTHDEVRRHCLDKIRHLSSLDIDGIWLDFIRYPSRWEKLVLMDTCYCDRCISLFESFIGEKIVKSSRKGKIKQIKKMYLGKWFEFRIHNNSYSTCPK